MMPLVLLSFGRCLCHFLYKKTNITCWLNKSNFKIKFARVTLGLTVYDHQVISNNAAVKWLIQSLFPLLCFNLIRTEGDMWE